MNNTIRLGVNIDHVATLRQARGTRYPDPVYAAQIAEQSGADGITLHLRDDRRHIQDRDVRLLKDILQTPMNFEMALSPFMLDFAEKLKPEYVCLVPEKREELTTEGGLDVCGQAKAVSGACHRLAESGIPVSLFIDPDERQVLAAREAGAPIVELHTGAYADAEHPEVQQRELERIQKAAKIAHEAGLIVNGGHGLHYHNVQAIAAIDVMNELNIGHAIVARALFSGFAAAVSEMKQVMLASRGFHRNR